MSYLKKIEYEIIPKDSFWVIRNCPKCGRKTPFKNTKKFRVNANGNQLDIWLIYQCSECKHTLNLPIYERENISSIPREEYQRFLKNDDILAETYGKKMQFFRKNKADIDFKRLNYDFVKLQESIEYSDFKEQTIITINNPYQLKIRPEKQIADVLGLSRSQVKKLLETGDMVFKTELPQFISVNINISLFHSDNTNDKE